MMANGITFDKLGYVERLQASGFSEPQAKGAAEALNATLKDDVALKDTVATKYDLIELKHDLTLRIGAMVVTGVLILAAMKFFA